MLFFTKDKTIKKVCSCGYTMYLRKMSDNVDILEKHTGNTMDTMFYCTKCPLVESYGKIPHPDYFAIPIRKGKLEPKPIFNT